MSIILDYHLQEQIPHTVTEFPVTYYHDELAALPDWTGPLHWHTDFENATVSHAVVGAVSEMAGGNLKTGLLAGTVFPAMLVVALIVLNRQKNML